MFQTLHKSAFCSQLATLFFYQVLAYPILYATFVLLGAGTESGTPNQPDLCADCACTIPDVVRMNPHGFHLVLKLFGYLGLPCSAILRLVHQIVSGLPSVEFRSVL